MFKKFLRKLKRFFTQDYSKPVNDYGSHGSSSPDFKPNWGIIVPHTRKKPGAAGYRIDPQTDKKIKIHEYFYGLQLVNLMRLPFATRDRAGVFGAAKELKRDFLVNASFEPHKNAFNKRAHGFEILVIKGDSLSGHYARILCEAFADKFPNRRLRHDNGIKWVEKGDRGYNNLVAAKRAGMEVALLGESFFIDNPAEWIEPETMAKFWTENLV